MTGSAMMTLLRARSQQNNYAQSVLGTFFMATGAQRQHFSLLRMFGVTIGYGGIVDNCRNEDSGAVMAAKAPELNALSNEE